LNRETTTTTPMENKSFGGIVRDAINPIKFLRRC
jgi:hypothetical protein